MSLSAMSHNAIMALLAPEVKLKMIWAVPDAAPAISGYENLVGRPRSTAKCLQAGAHRLKVGRDKSRRGFVPQLVETAAENVHLRTKLLKNGLLRHMMYV
jgi:hypothetical protein